MEWICRGWLRSRNWRGGQDPDFWTPFHENMKKSDAGWYWHLFRSGGCRGQTLLDEFILFLPLSLNYRLGIRKHAFEGGRKLPSPSPELLKMKIEWQSAESLEGGSIHFWYIEKIESTKDPPSPNSPPRPLTGLVASTRLPTCTTFFFFFFNLQILLFLQIDFHFQSNFCRRLSGFLIWGRETYAK